MIIFLILAGILPLTFVAMVGAAVARTLLLAADMGSRVACHAPVRARPLFAPVARPWRGSGCIHTLLLTLPCPCHPTDFNPQSIFCMLAVATCLRAFALHEYARQLTELAVSENGMLAGTATWCCTC